VFLICASGLSGEQMLAALRERMSHTPEAERAVAARELQKITVLRARKLTCTISTHVLDATTGVPAAGVTVVLEALEAADDPADGEWRVAGHGVTDADGRLRFSSAMEGSSESGFAAGEYALTFGTGEYFRRRETRSFYPKVTITFLVTSGHHHVPLLLSPFAYSTYRGS
jgi:hydroxyisourate hydrolase